MGAPRTAANDEVQTVGRIFPLTSPEPSEELITLLVAATTASLEFYDLTPLGPPKVRVRPVDAWVRKVWAGDGQDPGRLGEEVLIFLFSCVPKGSVN